jgi:hypothetical protein
VTDVWVSHPPDLDLVGGEVLELGRTMFRDDRNRGRPGFLNGRTLRWRLLASTLMERGSVVARGDARNGSKVAGTDGFPAGECE